MGHRGRAGHLHTTRGGEVVISSASCVEDRRFESFPRYMLHNNKNKIKKARFMRAFIFGLVTLIANLLYKKGVGYKKMIGQFIVIYSAALLDLLYSATAIIDRDKKEK